MDSFVREPRYALRGLALALGIGGSSAIFSVLENVVLRPLPVDALKNGSAATPSRRRLQCAHRARV